MAVCSTTALRKYLTRHSNLGQPLREKAVSTTRAHAEGETLINSGRYRRPLFKSSQEAALAAQERPPQRRRPAWAITVVVSAELVPCLDRLRVLAAGQEGGWNQVAGGCQPAWIAGRPALVGPIGGCRSHPQAPGSEPPSHPSAWLAPADLEP